MKFQNQAFDGILAIMRIQNLAGEPEVDIPGGAGGVFCFYVVIVGVKSPSLHRLQTRDPVLGYIDYVK